jgi:O-antigen/teichoic acid export membrane protein
MLARQVLGYLPTTILSTLFGFLSLVAFTRLLEPAQFGRYALVLATAELIHMTCFEWVALAYLRFYPEQVASGRLRHLRSTAIADLTVASASVAVLYAAVVALGPFGADLRGALWAGMPLILLRPVIRFLLSGHRAAMHVLRYGVTDVCQSGLGLACGVVLVRFLGFDERGALLGLAIGPGLVVLANAWAGHLDWKAGSIERRIAMDLVRYGLPLSGTFVSAFILSTSDRFMIEYFLGSEALGQYAAIFMLVSRALDFVFGVVQAPMNALMFQAMAKCGAAGARARLRKNGAVLVFIGLPATAGLAMVAEPMAHLLLGATYSAISASIAPGIVAATLLARIKNYFFDEGFHLARRNGPLIWTVIPPALLNIALNFILLPRLGVQGAVVATLISSFAALTTSAVLVRYIFPLDFPSSETGRTLVATAVMALALQFTGVPDGTFGLAIKIALGVAAFGAVSLALDSLGLRRRLVSYVCEFRMSSNTDPT